MIYTVLIFKEGNMHYNYTGQESHDMHSALLYLQHLLISKTSNARRQPRHEYALMSFYEILNFGIFVRNTATVSNSNK